MPDLVLPESFDDFSVDTIHARMMAKLPSDIDDMPGGFPFDFTMPTAIETSKLVQFGIVWALKMMFPQWAEDDYLELHGQRENVYKRAARAASGIVRVEGNIGVIIPSGTVFCTPATNDTASIMFVSEEEYMIENGIVDIPVTAMVAGRDSNVMSGSISLLLTPIEGVSKIANLEPINDGTDVEDQEEYRERIIEAYRAENRNVGNNGDYIRWAKECAGVGTAICINEWNGPGTVKLVITNSYREPASESICNDVYNYIMRDNDPVNRLAPIGASLTVVAPTLLAFTYVIDVVLADGYTEEMAIEEIKRKIAEYYDTAINENQIKYSKVFSIIVEASSTSDVSNVTINGGRANIPIGKDEYPYTKQMTLTTH